MKTLLGISYHSRIKFIDTDKFGTSEYIYTGPTSGTKPRFLNTETGEYVRLNASTYYDQIELIESLALSDGQSAVLYRYEPINYYVQDGIMHIQEANRVVKIDKLGYEIS